MLLHGFNQRIGINDSAAHSARLRCNPTIRTVLLVLFENEFTSFSLVEVTKFWISSLHLFEKMQDRLALIRKIHFRMQVHIDVKVVTQ